jgi:hypothetical protein
MAREAERSAGIHRFHDEVAIHFTSTHTLYLSASLARKVGEALIEYANDVEKYKFLASTLSTQVIE